MPNILASSQPGLASAAWPKQLVKSAATGELQRIYRGRYVETREWAEMSALARHLTTMRAAAASQSDLIFAQESAALLHALPVQQIPRRPVVLTPRDVRRGSSTYLRRTSRSCSTDPVFLPSEELWCTSIAETAVDLAEGYSFPYALAVMDGFARIAGPLKNAALELAGTLGSASAQRKVALAIEQANPLAGSVAESLSRAHMISAHAPLPQLQFPVHDDAGLVGFCDFGWPERKVVGEFDGRQKYYDAAMCGGRSIAERHFEEKRREDRIRAQGFSVVRWYWEDVVRPEQMLRKLAHSGIRSSRSARAA